MSKNVKWISGMFLCLSITLFAQQGETAVWQTVEFHQTGEERALYLFGIPDYVRTDMTWPEYLGFQKAPSPLRSVCFVYLPLRPTIPLFAGPLGSASSGSVCFQSGRVSQIEWQYSGDKAAPAYLAWLADKQTEMGIAGKLMISSKQVKNGKLFITCATGAKPLTCEGEVTVLLASKESR